MRKAFTLIELMVAISILTVMMIYLYQSYSTLNNSNALLGKELEGITSVHKIKRAVFLDFSLALHQSIKIENRDVQEDFVFFQSSHSLHDRFDPYVAYIVREEKLYRLESLKPFTEYYIGLDHYFDVDYLGEVSNFRVYNSKERKDKVFLIDIDFKNQEDLILKVNLLNQY